jgi:hypothetical protein
MAERSGKFSAHMFGLHPHWDHINAFPFFDPLYVPGNRFEVIGARHGYLTMENLLSAQMDDAFFPIKVTDIAASITYRDIGEETLMVDDDITVQSMLLLTPGTAWAIGPPSVASLCVTSPTMNSTRKSLDFRISPTNKNSSVLSSMRTY